MGGDGSSLRAIFQSMEFTELCRKKVENVEVSIKSKYMGAPSSSNLYLSISTIMAWAQAHQDCLTLLERTEVKKGENLDGC